MRLVVIESPFAGRGRTWYIRFLDRIANRNYARLALLDSLQRGEAPLASHLLYPQVLEDRTPRERVRGINAGFAWTYYADLIVVYADRGVTPGMKKGIEHAQALAKPIEFRYLLKARP